MTERGFLVALAPERLSLHQRSETKYEEAGPRVPCRWGLVEDRIVVYGPIEVKTLAVADSIGLVNERGRLVAWWAMRPRMEPVPAFSTISKEGEQRREGLVALEQRVPA